MKFRKKQNDDETINSWASRGRAMNQQNTENF
jgi:hypothetical protein